MRKFSKIQQQQADKYRKAGIPITDDIDVKGKPGLEGMVGIAFCEGKWQLCHVVNFTMHSNGKHVTEWAFYREPLFMNLIDRLIKLEDEMNHIKSHQAAARSIIMEKLKNSPLAALRPWPKKRI